MVDLKALQMELAFARRACREAQMAGLDLEHLIERMQAGRTLAQIALEDAPHEEPAPEAIPDFAAFRQAA